MTSKEVKVLTIGDVNGKFELLQKRLTAINKGNGPFDMVLCVGEFFGPDEELNQKVVDGSFSFPIPLYIMGPCCPSTAQFFPGEGVEFSPNLTFLGRRGVLHTAWGLTVAYLSGVPGQQNAFQFDEADINDLLMPIRAQSGFLGVDILLTSSWPSEVAKHSINQPHDPVEGSSAISRLAAALKPRYHFAGMGHHYERSPYRNHRVLVEAAQHVTRFIGLGPVGNPTKEKWIYAFNIKPMKFLRRAELTNQPPNTTEFPYMDILTKHVEMQRANEVQRNSSQFFFDRNNYEDEAESHEDEKRNSRKRHHEQQGPPTKRQQTITEENCWFCLSNEKAEKHLVVSVGAHTYMAMPKGPLHDMHVMVLSVGHVTSLVAAGQDVRDEVLKYRDAYTLACDQRGLALCIFERNFKTSHLQVQFVPVAKQAAAHLRSCFVEEASKRGIELMFMKEEEQVWDVLNPGQPYFYVELPDSSRLLARSMAGFPIQFAREVLCGTKLLNALDKVDWRDCALDKAGETAATQQVKARFKQFDFNADSDSDDD